MESIVLFLVVTKYFILTNAFQLKHYIADYPLQLCNEYMLGKFKPGWDFIGPLAAHVAIHGSMTMLLLSYFCSYLSWSLIVFLAILDMVIHFVMDRIKASPNMWGKYKTMTKKDFEDYQIAMKSYQDAKEADPYFAKQMDQAMENRTGMFKLQQKDNFRFWNSLGIDQLVHHTTDNLIVYIAILMLILGIG